MAEFIDRNDAAQALCHRLNDAKTKGFVVSILMDVPAADVKPVVRGKWIVEHLEQHVTCTCSVCRTNYYYYKRGQYHIDTSYYCPSCGARMEGADNE